MLMIIVISFSSCATLFTKKQTVTVTSDVVGAHVYKGNTYVGRTPLTFQTKSAKSTITVVKDGYSPQTINTDVAIRWNTLWNWFNCWAGWFVDFAAGTTQKYTKTDYFVSLKDPSINIAYNNQHQHQYNSIPTEQVLGILTEAAAAGVAAGQERKAINDQLKAEKEAKWRAEQQASAAQNKQKYAEFQAMTNNKAYSSNYQSNSSSYRTQGSYNDMLTSDPNRNMAIQQSVQQYGTNATRNAVNQANAYDAQSRSTGGYGGQIITAVTSNRRAIKIQVRDRKIGGRIVAYSLGGNATGQQQWRNTDGIISKCTSNYEYQYTAYLQGVGNIYFDM